MTPPKRKQPSPPVMFPPDRIRRAREEARLTQAELARSIGKRNPTSVSRYESGASEPPGHVIALMARATGKPRTWFVDEGEERLATAADEGVRAPTSFDPDAPAMPLGLQRLIDMGLPMRRDELEDLVAYADPLNKSRGARGAMGWTPGEWLNVLIEERRRRAGG
jgi:transcriptional regulator with XRE-family HTH domain